MKIVIVGDKHRAETWEQLLRKLPEVTEVIFMQYVPSDPAVDGVLLIDNSDQALPNLLRSVKNGNHTYLISRLFYQTEFIENIYHASEEAGVCVQFSHWPSLSDSIQWVKKIIPRPAHIIIKKDSVQANKKVIDIEDFNHEWIDEIALIIGIAGANIHKYVIKPVVLKNIVTGFSASFRFENSAVASFHFSGVAAREFHQRIFSDHQTMLDCDVLDQKITTVDLNHLNRITRSEKRFDSSTTAKNSLKGFIRSVQHKKRPVFSAYEAFSASKAVALISRLIHQSR